jgi:predicted NUDIX family NTP pyrophosphohydrolase
MIADRPVAGCRERFLKVDRAEWFTGNRAREVFESLAGFLDS